jgi:hypothetical protein
MTIAVTFRQDREPSEVTRAYTIRIFRNSSSPQMNHIF